MSEQCAKGYTAFCGTRCLASGDLPSVATKVKEALDHEGPESVLIFDDQNGEVQEVDLRGTIEDILKRLDLPAPTVDLTEASENSGPNALRGPGRPKLGVVAREVTLLPRHWDWLNSQPGGASVALRRLVDEARHTNSARDRVRHSQESAYRFMSAVAGNLPGYEEALRAIFAGNRKHFDDSTGAWPADTRGYALKLAEAAFHD